MKEQLVHALKLLMPTTLMVLSACSDRVMNPAVDPAAGLWLGQFTSFGNGESNQDSLRLIVCSGGDVVGTGWYAYYLSDRLYIEQLAIEMKLDVEGQLSGTVTWTEWLYGLRLRWAEGTVSGSLNLRNWTGQGLATFRTYFGLENVPWTVRKTQ